MGRKAKGIVNDDGRTCTKCGEFKAWSEFSIRTIGTRGKQSKCKLCVNTYYEENRDVILKNKKEYYEENKDTRKEYNKQYYEENRDAILEYQKQYYEENRDARKEYDKQYYEDKRDVKLEKQKQYYEENRDVVLEQKKQYSISPANYGTFKNQLTPLEFPRESKEGYLEVKCATCRKYFIPTNIQVQCRIQALNGNITGEHRLYCSDACKESCSVFGQRKYPKGFKKPSNREYSTEFRNMILERDNYTCQVCNNKFDKKHLQAHHITPIICSPMEQVDIKNGICICKECHINLHLTQEGITYAELIKAGKSKEDKDENED